MTHGDHGARLDLFQETKAASGAPAIIVLPGGGYGRWSSAEAEPVASWLAAMGLHTAILRYPLARHPAPLDFAQHQVALLKSSSSPLENDPNRVGVIGFSAGGHLAALLCSSELGRPDACILAYPLISMISATHVGATRNLLGPAPSGVARRATSADALVDSHHPPTFMWHTMEDRSVNVSHSLGYAQALARHDVDLELHVFNEGRHGLALADGPAGATAASLWTALAEQWLRRRAWLPPEAAALG